jgi:hypothetical protein
MALLYIFIISQVVEPDSAFWQLDSVYSTFEVVLSESLVPYSAQGPVFMQGLPEKTQARTMRISGVKDFSFDLNEGFDQGLKVSMNGEIEGVNIEGNLSDEASSGPTERISDIENMSLTATTEKFYAGIGDLTLDLPFAVRDEIEGGRISLRDDGMNNGAGVSYAFNRGKYRRAEFSGEEGRQGPYFLGSRAVYGSERVFLAQSMDPSRMLRRDEDYNIDYEQGIIMFTNRNIITTRSRITAEFQEATEDYSGIYQEADGQARYAGFQFNTMLRRVYDEKDNPLSFTLSQAEAESLRFSGDTNRVKHTFADTSASGSYDLVSGHFAYAGEGNGDYNVTFFYVGENNGEYVYDPVINGFSYRGPGLGNYSPDKYIPLPEDNQFYAIGITSTYGLAASLFGSRADRNTFSSIDDQDNDAGGYDVRFQRDTRYICAEAQYIDYDRGLTLPMAREPTDYASMWNTSETLEEMARIRTTVKPLQVLAFELGYGVLNRTHYRKAVTVKPMFLYFGYENVDTLDRYFCGLNRELKGFTVSTRYENLEKGHHFDCSAGYALSSGTKLGISGDYDRKSADRAMTTKFSIVSAPLNLSVGRRFYNDTTLLFANGTLNVILGDLTCRGEFQQSQRYSQSRDDAFVKVDEGTGDYVYDSITGSYLQKPGGDYIKKTFLLQDFQSVVTRAFGLDAAYAKGIFSLGGQFNYIDEENFQNRLEDLRFAAGREDIRVEVDLRQDMSEDGRYALETISTRMRSASVNPSYRMVYGYGSIKESSERDGMLQRTLRTDYAAEIDYEVHDDPQVKPFCAYLYGKLYSGYFEGRDIRLHAPRGGLMLAKPFKGKGRAEVTGELIFRKYNVEDVPYFFSATEPAGLTKVLGSAVSFGLGNNTVLNLTYRIQFPAGEKYYQDLRFQTRIKF